MWVEVARWLVENQSRRYADWSALQIPRLSYGVFTRLSSAERLIMPASLIDGSLFRHLWLQDELRSYVESEFCFNRSVFDRHRG